MKSASRIVMGRSLSPDASEDAEGRELPMVFPEAYTSGSVSSRAPRGLDVPWYVAWMSVGSSSMGSVSAPDGSPEPRRSSSSRALRVQFRRVRQIMKVIALKCGLLKKSRAMRKVKVKHLCHRRHQTDLLGLCAHEQTAGQHIPVV